MNSFEIRVLPDGRIKVTNSGGFAPEIHASADEFLDFVKELAGGECVTKKLPPNLAGVHSHQHGKHTHTHGGGIG